MANPNGRYDMANASRKAAAAHKRHVADTRAALRAQLDKADDFDEVVDVCRKLVDLWAKHA